MKYPNYMIKSPVAAKRDRLAAFFEAFDLSVVSVSPDVAGGMANLVVTGRAGVAERVILYGRADNRSVPDLLIAATVDFGGPTNPLMKALPETVEIDLDSRPTLRAVVGTFVAEGHANRCGQRVALNRLCELIVLLVLREAIDAGATEPGLLAGLSHPALQRAIVAMHDDPAKSWTVEQLAELSSMSRSRFMDVFPRILGTTPAAYLNGWRLMLGQRELMRGGQVKGVARRVGFGSAAAFSRAYSRMFGSPPRSVRATQLERGNAASPPGAMEDRGEPASASSVITAG
ncbi:AraC family transcriptional regulator [Bradyrhizobium sp. CCBAU 53351]|uniref:helix-turn-helix transcriptional regulator n=1 Tax=Bradyrhizobium sp. CCBAU 53351 TaxID=1325114 RepID=UPI001FF0682B|nr:AraC family transcriptional regulator [Bradyrhizobium sp. CCBAU 53351]